MSLHAGGHAAEGLRRSAPDRQRRRPPGEARCRFDGPGFEEGPRREGPRGPPPVRGSANDAGGRGTYVKTKF